MNVEIFFTAEDLEAWLARAVKRELAAKALARKWELTRRDLQHRLAEARKRQYKETKK